MARAFGDTCLNLAIVMKGAAGQNYIYNMICNGMFLSV